MELLVVWESALVLEKQLEETGYQEIRESFAPLVQKVLLGVQPQVVTGYATLLWFTSRKADPFHMFNATGSTFYIKSHCGQPPTITHRCGNGLYK